MLVSFHPSLDGFRLLSWWGRWPVWRLGCLVSHAIRADVARRGLSELSASASPRVTFHGQLVSEQRRARSLSATLIVKINGNQSPHFTLLSLPHSHCLSFLPRLCHQTSLCLPPVSLCCISIPFTFLLLCFCSSLANGSCFEICCPAIQLSLHYTLFDLFATSIELKKIIGCCKDTPQPNAFLPSLSTFDLIYFFFFLTVADFARCFQRYDLLSRTFPHFFCCFTLTSSICGNLLVKGFSFHKVDP